MKTYKNKPTGASHCLPEKKPIPKGAPNHAPDLPCPVGIDLHPDIFDAVELLQGKRTQDATVQRRFRKVSTAEILSWAEQHLDAEKNLLIIEATSNTFDTVNKLTDAGFSCVVIESEQVGKVADAFFDDDQLAAERIARCYLTGMATVVWVPDEKTRERRELLHAYDGAVGDHVRALNELKSYLTTRNIRPQRRNLHLAENRQWIENQIELSKVQSEILEGLFKNLDHAKAMRDQFYHMICTEMLAHKQMLNALRVVGIGMINAFAIVAIVGDIKRFANPRKLVSYLGLNPGRKKSGLGKSIKKPAGKRGRRDMRAYLIQAAQVVLNKTRAEKNRLARWGFRLFARTGKRNIAVVAIARKLAHALYYILAGKSTDLLEQRGPMKRKLNKLSAEIGKEGRKKLGLPEKRSEFVAHLFEKIGWPEEPHTEAASAPA
jgi:transposase